MLIFNARPFGDMLRARLPTPSRAWRCCSSWPLHDSGCVLGHIQSPELG